MKTAYIIGGGPLGIGITTELLKRDYEIILIEGQSKLLGLAQTFDYENFKVEKYYHFFYRNDHFNSLNWLLENSTEQPQIIWKDISTDSYVQGTRYNLDSPLSVLKLCKWKAFRVLWTLMYLKFLSPPKSLDKVSAKEWALKTFGDFGKKVWIPLLDQKFDSHAEEISALWLATRIKRHMSTRGNGLGKSRFGYLKDTYEPYVENFAERIIANGGQIIYDEQVLQLKAKSDKIVSIHTRNLEFNTENALVFSSISLANLKNIVVGCNGVKGLNLFENKSVMVLILFLDLKLSDHYWTTVTDNEIEFQAIIQQNRLHENTSYEVVYLSRYCDHTNQIFLQKDEIIVKKWILALMQIYPHLSDQNIIDHKLFRSKNAAPVPFQNYNRELNCIENVYKNFYFQGFENIFPEDRGVGNSIYIGRKLVDHVQ